MLRLPRFGDIGTTVAVAFLAIVLCLVVTAPWLPIAGYEAMDGPRLSGPSLEHWFGTDEFGRDLFSRVVYGARTSILVAGIGVSAGTMLGIVLGLVTGYVGGVVDTALMRFLDGLLAFPSLILAIGVTAITGPGIAGVSVALAFVGVPQMARIVRSAVLVERELQYVEGARAVGANVWSIMVRHLIPNILSPILVQVVIFFVTAVLTEAGLSFLGFGVQAPLPSLGSLLQNAKPLMAKAPWYVLAPAVSLTAIVLALNILADRLASISDPRK